MSFVKDIVNVAQKRGTEPLLIEVRGSELDVTTGTAFVIDLQRVRACLAARGVAVGDRVALLAPNSARWAAVDVAIMAHGAIVVPLYARQDPQQLAGMLRDASPRLVIAGNETLASALAAAWSDACPIVTYDEVFACEPQALELIEPQAQTPVTIIYTSGTSGEPKGVVLNAGNVSYMLQITVERIAEMSPGQRPSAAPPGPSVTGVRPKATDDRVFHYLPFCFAGSRIMLWSQLWRGNPLMVSTDLDNLQEELRTAKPQYFMNVPVLLDRIRNGVESRLAKMGKPLAVMHARAFAAHQALQAGTLSMRERMWLATAQKLLFPRVKQLIGPNLEFLVCGSARLAEETQSWFQMIGIPVYQVYGLTETTGIVSIDDTRNVKAGRVGFAIPGCELKLSEEGELLCRGPNMFAGYFNRPEATAQMLRDGWLHTGDQAELDEAGSVKIVGRLRDVLVPESGHNVAPGPIEEKLVLSGVGVEQAVVVGHGRPYLTAIVTGARDADLDVLRDQVNAQLPHYQRLRKLYRAPEPFSIESGLLTANQKLRRSAIEAHYKHAIEDMYR